MSYKKDNILEVFDALDLEETQRRVIKVRYGGELNSLCIKSKRSTNIYTFITIVFTTLSIILPGLLSIQKSSPSLETPIYWTSWGISLLLTLLQGYTKLFKIDRNFYFYNFNYERFLSEGWNYIHLGGRYNTKDTHIGAYKRFMRNIERMKLENVNLEYTEVKDSDEVTKKKKKRELNNNTLENNNLRESIRESISNTPISNENETKSLINIQESIHEDEENKYNSII
jgi:hypothetical protein